MVPAALSRLRVLNVRELRTHWGRAVASVAVIAVCAALLVAVLGVSGSITGSIDRLATSIGGDADLEISGITDDGVDESLFDTVAAQQSVAAAVPLVRMPTTVNSDRILLLGVGPNISALHSDLEAAIRDQVRDNGAEPSAPNGVVVGAGLGIARGDTFEIGAAGPATSGRGSIEVTAAQVVDGPAARRLNAGHFVIAPLPFAQQIAGRDHRLDSILIFKRPGTGMDQLRSDVTKAVGGRAVVATPSFRAAQASSSFAILQTITLLAASVSFVVAAFLSYNAMSIAIAQRRPVISTLRALGGRRRTIVGDMLAEAAMLGVVGGAVGSLVGIVIGRVAIGGLPSTMVQSLEARIEYVLPLWVVPLAIAACVLASVVASALAARQVHSVSPVEALASGSEGFSAIGSHRLRVAAGIAGLSLVGATTLLVVGDVGRLAVASIALAFIGAAALCFAFSVPIIRSAAAVARRFGGPGALGAASIERAPQRMWVATMTVLTAVVTTVAVSGATSNAVDSTVASFSSVADTDVWVSSAAATDYSTTVLPPDTEASVLSVPGVEHVVPEQSAFATIGDTRVMLLGIADGSHRDIYTSMSPRDRAELLAGQGVALSRDLGRAMGVSPGQEITLQTPSGERRVPVLALIPYFSGLTGTIAISLPTLQTWFMRPGASDLEVTVAPDADPHSVQAAISKAVPKGVFVYSGQEALAGVSSALDQVTSIITIISWIVAAVAAVTLLNTLMLSVLDRRREIGVLRALGSTRRFALSAVVAEAAGIAVVGGLLALIIGAALQYLATIALTNVLSIDVEYHASPAMIGIALAALALCLLGALPPAFRAARLNIVEAVGVD